jgi:hypothetical protein
VRARTRTTHTGVQAHRHATHTDTHTCHAHRHTHTSRTQKHTCHASTHTHHAHAHIHTRHAHRHAHTPRTQAHTRHAHRHTLTHNTSRTCTRTHTHRKARGSPWSSMPHFSPSVCPCFLSSCQTPAEIYWQNDAVNPQSPLQWSIYTDTVKPHSVSWSRRRSLLPRRVPSSNPTPTPVELLRRRCETALGILEQASQPASTPRPVVESYLHSSGAFLRRRCETPLGNLEQAVPSFESAHEP